MDRLIYYALLDTRTGEETATVDTWRKYHVDTFNPNIKATCIIDFVIHGKTYAEKKKNLQEMAIEFSNNTAPGLYWSDEVIIQDFFEKNGRRYGLLREFQENAII